MEIFYKELYTDDEFKSAGSDNIDLSKSILKITSDDLIKEIEIDGERIEKESSNEIIFNRINTSAAKKINMIIKTIDENGKEKKHSRVINIDDSRFIYDKNIIKKIDYRGKIAFENLQNEKFNEIIDEYESLEEILKLDINKINEFLNDLKKIIILSREILNSPKVELIETEEVRDSNEVKKINSNSARYFTMHPEDWYQRGRSMPKPLKMLTNTYQEIKDIYENRMVVYVLNAAINKLKDLEPDLESEKYTLKTRINRRKREFNLYVMDEKSEDEYLIEIREDTKKLNSFEDILKKIKNLKIEIKSIIEGFKGEVKYIKTLKVRMTQKILYDNRYKIIFNFYKKYSDDFTIADKREIKSSIDSIHNYMFIITEEIVNILFALGFWEITQENKVAYENLFINFDSYIIKSKHFYDENFEYKITVSSVKTSYPMILLEFKYYDKKYSICMKVNIDYKNKKEIIEYNDIEKIYENNINDKYDMNIVFNTIDFKERYFKDEKTKLKSVFMLSNMGNNFLTKEDYEKYGSFKMAVVPYSSEYMNGIRDRFNKLFKMLFIKIGFSNYCTNCSDMTLVEYEDGILKCMKCGRRIAINKCKNCGEISIKFLAEKENNDKFNSEKSDKGLFEYHEEYESGANNIGSCYERYYSNSGGFCSKCGKCTKNGESCIRCKEFNLEV